MSRITLILLASFSLARGAPAQEPAAPDLLATLRAEGSFTQLLAALDAAGLSTALEGDEPLTLFAPTDEAFARYPEEELQALLAPENRPELGDVLRFHAVAGRWTLEQFGQRVRLPSLQGSNLALRWSGGDDYSVDVARLLRHDIECANGILHVIDDVLLPPQSDLLSAEQALGRGRHTYAIDPDHSSVLFRVMHMDIGATYGWFTSFEGELVVDSDKPTANTVVFGVDVSSIDTRNDARDQYLQTKDFFDAEEHPSMTFAGRGVRRLPGGSLELEGDLSLRGITKRVSFPVRKLGQGRFGPAHYRVGFEGRLRFNRSDYGMTFGIPGVAADEVEITIALEGVREL